MKYTKIEIQAMCVQVAECLKEALDAITNPAVLEEVARLALAMPQIAWDPTALAAAAINALREMKPAAAAVAKPASEPLPPEPSSSDAPVVSLPNPAYFY